MLVKTVKVSEKGQIAIPTSIRKKMGISRQDDLLLVYKDGKLLIEPAKHLSREFDDDFKDIMKLIELSMKDVWDNEDDDRAWNDAMERYSNPSFRIQRSQKKKSTPSTRRVK